MANENRGLGFMLSLRDSMSKPLKTIKQNTKSLQDAMEKTAQSGTKDFKSVGVALQSMNDRMRDTYSSVGKVQKSLSGSGSKSLSSSFSTATKQAKQTDLSVISLIGSLKKLRTFAIIEFGISLVNFAQTMNNSLIELNKRIDITKKSDLSGVTTDWKNLRDLFSETSQEMGISLDRISRLTQVLTVDQLRLGEKRLKEYTKSVAALTFATNLSEMEAANALNTFQLWYGVESDFKLLSNQIRFLSATTRLSANEAVDAAKSFQDVALSLQLMGNFKGKDIAQQTLTIAAMVKKARGDVGEFATLFQKLTSPDLAVMGQSRAQLEAFFNQAGMSVNLDNLIDKQGNLVEVFLLMQKAAKQLSLQDLRVLYGSMDNLAGVSGKQIQLLRQYNGNLDAFAVKSKQAATQTTQIDKAVQRNRDTIASQIEQMKSAFTPILVEIGEKIREISVMLMKELVPLVKDVSKFLGAWSPLVTKFFDIVVKVGKFMSRGFVPTIRATVALVENLTSWITKAKVALESFLGVAETRSEKIAKNIYDRQAVDMSGRKGTVRDLLPAEFSRSDPTSSVSSSLVVPSQEDAPRVSGIETQPIVTKPIVITKNNNSKETKVIIDNKPIVDVLKQILQESRNNRESDQGQTRVAPSDPLDNMLYSWGF